MAALTYWQRDMATSTRYYLRSLALFEELGEQERIADTLFALSAAANFLDELELGREYGERASAAYEKAGVTAGIRKVHTAEAFRVWQSGDLEGALLMWEESRDMFAEAGDISEQLQTEVGISAIRYQLGFTSKALSGVSSTLERVWEIEDVPGTITALALAASLLAEQDPVVAVQAGAAASTFSERTGGALQPGDYGFPTAAETLEPTMDSERYAAAVTAGVALSLEQAVTSTLEALGVAVANNAATRTIS